MQGDAVTYVGVDASDRERPCEAVVYLVFSDSASLSLRRVLAVVNSSSMEATDERVKLEAVSQSPYIADSISLSAETSPDVGGTEVLSADLYDLLVVGVLSSPSLTLLYDV